MKKVSKFTTIIITTLSLFIAMQKPQPAHALALYWNKPHWITLTRNATIYKMRNTDPLAYSYVVAKYHVKKGSHYRLSHWGTNYSWVLQSGKYSTGTKYTYMVNKKYNDASWFKMGIIKKNTKHSNGVGKLSGATPNLKGTWNRSYSNDSFGKTITIKNHTIKLSPNGKTYKMSVTNVAPEHYRITPKGRQGITIYVRYKTLYGDFRPVLNLYTGSGNSAPTSVYFKGKKVIKLKNHDLAYPAAPSKLKDCLGKDVFTSEITDKDSPASLAKTKKDYEDDNYVTQITTPGVAMHLTKFVSDFPYRFGQVTYNGQTLLVTAGDDLSDVVPYNTYRYSGFVVSSVKPTDTTVLLKHGQTIRTNDTWQYFNPTTGTETDYSFSLKRNVWSVDN